MSALSSELLQPGRIREIRLDLTSRCNLRCVYCAVSHPDYRGTDMPSGLIEKSVASIVGMLRHNPINPISLNGHGETTILDGWVTACRQLLDRGIPVRITTNLAKQYSPAEFDTLARMESIGVSIDTADAALLKRMRRKVGLSRIVENIKAIRVAADRLHISRPLFHFGCGLYDKSADVIPVFADFVIDMQIRSVYFWDMSAHTVGFADVAESDRPVPLRDLPAPRLRELLPKVLAAVTRLREQGVICADGGNFVERLWKEVDRHE